MNKLIKGATFGVVVFALFACSKGTEPIQDSNKFDPSAMSEVTRFETDPVLDGGRIETHFFSTLDFGECKDESSSSNIPQSTIATIAQKYDRYAEYDYELGEFSSDSIAYYEVTIPNVEDYSVVKTTLVTRVSNDTLQFFYDDDCSIYKETQPLYKKLPDAKGATKCATASSRPAISCIVIVECDIMQVSSKTCISDHHFDVKLRDSEKIKFVEFKDHLYPATYIQD